MSLLLDNRVLLVSLSAPPLPQLARMALRNRWPLLTCRQVGEAMKLLRKQSPRIAGVQLLKIPAEDITLIRQMQTRDAGTVVIALSDAPHAEQEAISRVAGANCYLPIIEDASLVERTIKDLLEQTSSRCSSSDDIGRDCVIECVVSLNEETPGTSVLTSEVGTPSPLITCSIEGN